jgi:hypothetical protein
MENNKGIYGLVALVAAAIFGVFFFTGNDDAVTASPEGATFNTAKVAAIVMAPNSNAASSTSILNSDANDRIVTDSFVTCNSFGTSPSSANASAVTVKAATTTVASLGLQGNANFAANFTFSTSTLNVYSATSTEGVITGTSRVWPAGKYMTYNLTATSTAGVCVVGSHYLAL